MRFQGFLSEQVFKDEIVVSKKGLEDIIEKDVTAFAWVGGEENSYNSRASEYIERTYEMSFLTNSRCLALGDSPYLIERTNI